jgi:hypothetical protein
VWTQREFAELLAATSEEIGFEIELFLKRKYEVIAVLRKGEPAARQVNRIVETRLPVRA